MLMKRDDSLLLIIDVQERLAPAMDNPREVITGCAALVGVAAKLNVPVIITEQYPKGLGQTMIDIRQAAGDRAVYLQKMEFSCAANPEIMNHLKNSGKKQIVIAGVEAHICVTQTALALQQAGYEVFVVSNANSSRDPLQTVVAFQRLLKNGIDVVSSEMVIFEWLEKAGSEEFKEISKKYIV